MTWMTWVMMAIPVFAVAGLGFVAFSAISKSEVVDSRGLLLPMRLVGFSVALGAASHAVGRDFGDGSQEYATLFVALVALTFVILALRLVALRDDE